MKKKSLKLLACVLAMGMALSLGACGDSKKDSDSDSDKRTERSSKEDNDDNDEGILEETEKPDSSSSSKKFKSIEEYLADETVQSQLESLKNSFGSDMSVDVRGEDNKLIYSYKFTTIVKEEGMEESIASEAEKQASVFESTANSLKLVVDVEDPVVVLEYIDANGEMIFTKEYTAE